MKHFLTFSLLFIALGLYAQPANDDCAGLVNLGPAPICDSTLYNNVGATESNIGFDNFPPCFVGNPQRDVWFSFVAVDTILDYRVLLIGCPDPDQGISSIVNPQIALYRGDCEFDGLQLLDCVSSAAGGTEVQVDLIGLTPGISYFLRINDWSPTATPNSGAFKLCITKKPPINTIDQGGSTLCSGTLTDSGGEDGDYGNNENHVFTICPSTPHNCINFTLQYYNIEGGTFGNPSDQLIFYDGPGITSPVIATINGIQGNNPSYGGVCYSVSASSGCLTVQFISDASATYEGFLGNWECTAAACQASQPMAINTNATPEEIVQSVLSGQTLITVTNINCGQGALGTFEAGPDSELGLEKGLVLTSGSAANVANPATFFTSAFTGSGTDADLNYLSVISGNGSMANDACIVELEVFAATDEITFEYIFGSEEYPEWVNTTFNDIFAFLVSGPGIVGDPNINNQLNIATLPNGTFIQINSVNDGVNWQYYRDNSLGQRVVYDGLTSDFLGVKKSLTASVATIPCNTYKLKLAIADRGDTSFDSGVFISEIKGGSPNLGVNYQNGINYLVEDCTSLPDEITISLNAPIEQPATYTIVVTGTAELGVDYLLDIPSTITFNTGNEVFTYSITPLSDGLVEGIEFIEIKLIRDFGCGEVVLATLVIELHDNLQVDIFDGQTDTLLVCGGSCPQLFANGAADYFWQPPGLFNNPNIPNPTICPDSSMLVVVTGTLGICTDKDSIWLQLITPEVEILPGGPLTICQNDTLVLTATNNVNNSNLLWTSFFVPIQNPTNPVQTIIPSPFNTFISLNVSVELGGCTATDNITITVDPFAFPQVASDTIICQNYSVQLASDIIGSTTTFSWTPTTGLSPSGNVSGPIATPDVTTTYTLIASSQTGTCNDTAQVTVTVIPADVKIQAQDTVFICVGDSVALNATNTTAGVGVEWLPQQFLTQVSPEQVVVYPPESTWYYVTLQTANCFVLDSVLVYVDSLPDLSISAIPDKSSYCQGEQVTLVSPTYEPANFPGITLLWTGNPPGALTPDSFLNMVILAVESYTYIRTTRVNACFSADSIRINVVPVTAISIDPPQASICPGDPVSLNVIADPAVTNFTWTPPNNLSCTNCPNPVATPNTTTTYNVEGEFDGCPVGAAVTITVVPAPTFTPPANPNICPGDQIQLNGTADPNSTYSWTASDGSLNTNNPQPIVSPTQTTTYFMTASNGSCDISAQVTVVVAMDFTLTVGPGATVCLNRQVPLTASASTGNVTFIWTDPDGNQITPPINVQSEDDAGIYTVTAISGEGCFVKQGSITIGVYPPLVVTAGPDETITSGQSVTLQADASLPGTTFVWTNSSGAVVGTSANVTLSLCGSDVFTVTGAHPNGCDPDTDAVSVTVTSGFVIDSIVLMTNDTLGTLFEGEEFSIEVFTTPTPIPGATYEWFVNGELIATTNVPNSGRLNAPEVFAPTGENFVYDVLITDASGCSTLDTILVTVLNNPVEVPNIFSPNNDGLNDIFTLVSRVPVSIVEFKVWNRWGQMVYDSQSSLAGWDGTQNGDPAPSDVYVYYIKYEITGGTGRQYVEKGDVTLLR